MINEEMVTKEWEVAELESALRVCLGYWLEDADPSELSGSVEKFKRLSRWDEVLNDNRR